MTPLLVAAGAALGALLRFWVAHHLDGRTPWGTSRSTWPARSCSGCWWRATRPPDALALLGTGFCGGLTTYSAFAVQTRDQGRDRGPAAGAAYAVATIGLALAACALGFAIGQA